MRRPGSAMQEGQPLGEKCWRRERARGVPMVCVTLLVIATAAWLVGKPRASECRREAAAGQRVQEIVASETVVRPWTGLHQVYGLFVVPEQYRLVKRYVIVIAVDGIDYYCSVERHRAGGVSAGDGSYVVRQYVPTRVAVWFLMRGLLAELRRPSNWALIFVDEAAPG